MSIQTVKAYRRWLGPVALALSLAIAGFAPLAFARVAVNTIDPEAVVSDDGRRLLLTGPLACTDGEESFLRVTVTQRSTGAVAGGRALIRCDGNTNQWEVVAFTRGKPVFEAGPATAVAIARTTDRGNVTDAHQWLVEITLVAE
jgi:hypothetical protein